jgi:membrane associated rhomboid family serine protease
MPYRCSYCDSVHCEQHRLPEAHTCPGKQQAEARARERRRSGHPGVEMQGGGFSEPSRGRGGGFAGGSGLWNRLQGNVTKYLLFAIVGVFVLESVVEPRLLTGFGAGDQPNALFSFLFVLDANWWTKPWTLLTSVFAHGGLGHLFFNGIILFFFGPLLEKRIGAKAFLGLVLAGGVLAGLTQVTFYSTFLGQESGVLGISGALMAVMGALTVLGPHIRVLIFFFIPAPLWAMMLGYAALDLLGFLGGGGGVAHLAHLTGLAVGLAAGWRWRQEGYAFPKRRTRLQGGMRQGF